MNASTKTLNTKDIKEQKHAKQRRVELTPERVHFSAFGVRCDRFSIKCLVFSKVYNFPQSSFTYSYLSRFLSSPAGGFWVRKDCVCGNYEVVTL